MISLDPAPLSLKCILTCMPYYLTSVRSAFTESSVKVVLGASVYNARGLANKH